MMSQNNTNKNYVNLGVRPETKKRLVDNCKKEYLHHHPEMKGIPLSQDFLLGKVIDFYLKGSEFG